MIRIYPYIFSLLACIGIALPGYSQVDRNETLIRSALHGLEYEIKAGFSIGGTAPLPLPVEIRSIDGYNPTLAISIGGEVTKWIAVQNKLGIIVGLRLENKAMTTEATVKNYNMEILGQGGERISGVWTGGVKDGMLEANRANNSLWVVSSNLADICLYLAMISLNILPLNNSKVGSLAMIYRIAA